MIPFFQQRRVAQKNLNHPFISIQQKTPTSEGGDECICSSPFSGISKHLLNENKASGGCHGFLKGMNCAGTIQNPDAITPRQN